MAGLPVELTGDEGAFLEALQRLLEVGQAKTIVINAPGQDQKIETLERLGDVIPFEPLEEVLLDAIEEALPQVAEGELDAGDCLELIGEALEEGVRAVIEEGLVEPGEHRKNDPPKNRTGKPLYDTGELAESLEYEVVR